MRIGIGVSGRFRGWAASMVVAWIMGAPAIGYAEEVQKMTPDMEKALGSSTVVVEATDQDGNQVVYLREDLYNDVQRVNRTQAIDFPIEPVSKILAVTPPHGEDQKIYIFYEASPAEAIECKFVNGKYRCYTS